jgi:hypothetical protein
MSAENRYWTYMKSEAGSLELIFSHMFTDYSYHLFMNGIRVGLAEQGHGRPDTTGFQLVRRTQKPAPLLATETEVKEIFGAASGEMRRGYSTGETAHLVQKYFERESDEAGIQ